MFLRNVLFFHLAFLQTVFSSQNNNLQYYIVSTTQEPSKMHEKSNRVYLDVDFDTLIAAKLESLLQNQFKHQNEVANEMKNQIEELKQEIVVLKDDYNKPLIALKSICESNLETQLKKLKDEQLTVLNEHKNQFVAYKNSSESQLRKLEEKQKLFEQLLISHSDITKTYLENVNTKLKNLNPPENCKDLLDRGKTLSGVYTIWPSDSPKSFDVWCDMETRGGGWIYFVYRFDGSLDFNLKWIDYKNGFGDLSGEHWLGLEHLYLLTRSKTKEILIELVDHNSTKAYARYKQFSIGNESEGYPIKTIKGYSGDAGDDFSHHSGWKFTASDRNHNPGSGLNCALEFGGGFWYGSHCYRCLFTGSYNSTYRGIKWFKFRGFRVPLREVKMMIRP